MIWSPGLSSLANPGTKTGSSLTQSLHSLLIDDMIPFDYENAVMQSSDPFTG